MSERPFKTPMVNDSKLSSTEVIAIILTVFWVAAVGLFFWILPPASLPDTQVDSLRMVLIVMAIFLPVAMIWVAVAAARSARIMREESQRLQAAIDGMRETYVNNQVRSAAPSSQPTVERKLEEIAQSAKKTESAVATFATNRETIKRKIDSPADTSGADDQPSLELGTTAEDMAPPLSKEDLIRAINFPDTEQDQDGFTALRRGLRDRNVRELIQASQDVLTLMSQDGIYMDDLRPDRARPEIWRRFAGGERGSAVAALGGVRDRSSLALTAARMREDTIFRDTAHHFLRKFDQMLVRFEQEASDGELVALAETRSARAFMLLGRVTGAFD